MSLRAGAASRRLGAALGAVVIAAALCGVSGCTAGSDGGGGGGGDGGDGAAAREASGTRSRAGGGAGDASPDPSESNSGAASRSPAAEVARVGRDDRTGGEAEASGGLERAEQLARLGLYVKAARAVLGGEEGGGEAGASARALEVAAILYHRAGSYSKGRELAERAAAAGRGTPLVRYIIGDSMREQALPEESLEALRSLARDEPGFALGRLGLGRVLFRVAEAEDALPHFRAYLDAAGGRGARGAGAGGGEFATEGAIEAIASGRDEASQRVARVEYARALRSARRLQESADVLAELLEMQPSSGDLYRELARTLYRMGSRQAARFVEDVSKLHRRTRFEEEIEERLRISGKAAMAVSQEALNLEEDRRFLEAWRRHRTAMSIGDPPDARVVIFYIEFCRRFRRHDDARSAVDAAIARGVSPLSHILFLRGALELETGDVGSTDDVAAARRRSAQRAAEWFEKSSRALAAEAGTTGATEAAEAAEAAGAAGAAVAEEKGRASRFAVLLAMGRAALEAGRTERAAEVFRGVREEYPSAWEPRFWLGRVLLAEEETSRAGAALWAFDEALEAGGAAAAGSAEFTLWHARAMAREGRRAEAAERLAKLAQSQPVSVEIYEALAEAFEGDEARHAAAESSRERARVLWAKVDELTAALQRREPEGCAPLYAQIGRILVQLRDPRALDLLLIAAELDPDDLAVRRDLVQGIRRPQDVFFRLRFLRQIEELDPKDESALAGLALAYAQLGVRLEEALELAERLRAVTPDGVVSYRVLAQVLRARGQVDDGVKVLREGLVKHPNDEILRGMAAAAAAEETEESEEAK